MGREVGSLCFKAAKPDGGDEKALRDGNVVVTAQGKPTVVLHMTKF